jgi:hypothetical protein
VLDSVAAAIGAMLLEFATPLQISLPRFRKAIHFLWADDAPRIVALGAGSGAIWTLSGTPPKVNYVRPHAYGHA